MSRGITARKTIEVDIDLEDFDTDDLIDELENRGIDVYDPDYPNSIITELYELKRANDPRFDKVFGDYIYDKIGRIL